MLPKGKVRTIFIPDRLCRRLLQYARKQKITSGEIFLTGGGKRLSRTQIWAEMKRLCRAAGNGAGKSFPTICGTCSPGPFTGNLYRDVVKLADILVQLHQDTDLPADHRHAGSRQLERLGLLC